MCRCYDCGSESLAHLPEGVTCTECAVVQHGSVTQEGYDDEMRSAVWHEDDHACRRREDCIDLLPLHCMCLPEQLRDAARGVHTRVRGKRRCSSFEMAAACLHACLHDCKIAMRTEELTEAMHITDTPDSKFSSTAFADRNREVRSVVTEMEMPLEDVITYLAQRLPLTRKARYQAAAKAIKDNVSISGKPHTAACVALARHVGVKTVAEHCRISEPTLRKYAKCVR